MVSCVRHGKWFWGEGGVRYLKMSEVVILVTAVEQGIVGSQKSTVQSV
jgi:hypothetical protein